MGRKVLTVLLGLMIVATAVADLGFMHALNDAWPPHARFHAIWNVVHVAATHSIALIVLWKVNSIIGMRVAAAIFVANAASFFLAALLAPMFDASTHPDLAAADMPPTLFGLDGNALGFLLALPIAIWAWRSAERAVVESG